MTTQALSDLKVIEFCWLAAGPTAGMYLSHHGATVIRIESSLRPELLRNSAPFKDAAPGINRSAMWAALNSNKLGMSLNLNHEKAKDVVSRLLTWGDIVGESFAPGVMASWGLGYEELSRMRPDVIMYSTSNLGQTGPEAAQTGLGTQLVAYSGFTCITGWPDRMPAQPYGAYTDFVAPRFLVAALISAVEYRSRTGKGQYLDLSQMETAIQFLAPTIMDYTVNGRIQSRMGNRCPYASPHGAFPCSGDDSWCAISVLSDDEWDSLCSCLHRPEWTADRRFATVAARKQNEEELERLLSESTRNFAAEELMEKLQSMRVPAGIVKSGPDLHEDPQLLHRNHFCQLEHPEIGTHCYEMAPGFTLSKTPAQIAKPAPLLGEHTELVCRELLGMSDEEFVSLFTDGVFD